MTFGNRTVAMTAQVVNGEVPFLIGIDWVRKQDVHICCATGRFILPGPGGLELKMSPGTESLQMIHKSQWMLPINKKLDEVYPVQDQLIGPGIVYVGNKRVTFEYQPSGSLKSPTNSVRPLSLSSH